MLFPGSDRKQTLTTENMSVLLHDAMGTRVR